MAAYEDEHAPNVVDPNSITGKKVTELDNKKKMDLIIISANPQIQALWDLMEMIVINARDIAMDIEPHRREEQSAAMTIAHAMNKMYTSVRQNINFITKEHLNQVRLLDQQKKLGTPEEVEKLYMAQLENELNQM